MKTLIELQDIAKQVRRDIVRMTNKAKSGHPGGSLGCTEYMTALHFNIMNADPARFTMEGRGEDMFFMSNGHITPVLYSVMARRGYFPVEELALSVSSAPACRGIPPQPTTCRAYAWPPARWDRVSP